MAYQLNQRRKNKTESLPYDDETLRRKPLNRQKLPKSDKHGCLKLCSFFTLIFTAVVCISLFFIESPIEPNVYNFADPPEWTGPLAQNHMLTNATWLFLNQLIGPESIVILGDSLYTSTYDGKIIQIRNNKIVKEMRLSTPPCGEYDHEPICGRPLGMRKYKENKLLVADAYLGIFLLDVRNGEAKRLVEGGAKVNGKKLTFLNDVTVLTNGSILFTDSSSKWQRRNFWMNIFEHSSDGRLLLFDTETGEIHVLLSNLHFPNGIQLSKDEEFLLIAETTKARILRYWLDGDKEGGVEVFSDNLPGFPDNVRIGRNDTFWVGMAAVRNPQKKSMIDFLGHYPLIRKLITKIIPAKYMGHVIFKFLPRYGLAVQMDGNGKIVGTLHDPTGKTVPSISEIEDTGKILYIGSYHYPFLAKIDY